MKEAYLYEKKEDNKVKCFLCAHRCLIYPQNRGICNVRQARNGKLETLVYGKAIAEHIDPIEKKPLYHFLPSSKAYSIATIGCNFRCEFCQNWRISQYTNHMETQGSDTLEPEDLPGHDLPPETIVDKALQNNCTSIAYTYTEPTIFFEYAYDSAKMAQSRGLKNIFVTNGYQTTETVEKMKGVIDAANIDLKSFSDKYYRNICGATLQPVLDSIKNMHDAGIWVEVTTLVVPKQNDSDQELTDIAEFIAGLSKDIPWHISRFHPNNKMVNIPPTPLETLEKAAQIGHEAGLNFIYIGNVPGKNRWQNTYCPDCGELAIKRVSYQTENRLKEGKCSTCGNTIPGIWT